MSAGSARPAQLDRQDALETIAILSSVFRVPVPTLNWAPRNRNGRYRAIDARLTVGPKAWRGVEPNLLHEFAHHVDYSRNRMLMADEIAAVTADARRTGIPYPDQGLSSHGIAFTKILMDVVEAWGVPYRWTEEYKIVQRIRLAILSGEIV